MVVQSLENLENSGSKNFVRENLEKSGNFTDKAHNDFSYIFIIRNNAYRLTFSWLVSKLKLPQKMLGNFWKFCLENLEKSGKNIPAKFEHSWTFKGG